MSDSEELVGQLAKDGLTLAVAESCTGGLLGARITDMPGASKVFLGGIIAYDDRVKVRELGLDATQLKEHGAVSAVAVEAMAHAVRNRFGASLSAAVSGIAGPDGATMGKPVGTVWLAAVGPGDLVNVHRIHATGDRTAIRAAAVAEALRLLQRNILEAEQERLV